MPRLAIITALLFFVSLAIYRFFFFIPPAPPAYPDSRPFPGNGFEAVDPLSYDVTNLYDNLSLPQTLYISVDDRLIIIQATGEILAFSRDAKASFTAGPRLLASPAPDSDPNISRPDVAELVRRRAESIEKGYTSQIVDSVTDPQTGAIYFIDRLDGRLYRTLPLPPH